MSMPGPPESKDGGPKEVYEEEEGLGKDNRRVGILEVQASAALPLETFLIPHHYSDVLDHVMIPHGMILDRIEKLARDIRADYADRTIHLICVLKGGSAFFSDLLQALRRFHTYSERPNVPLTFEFISVKSYHGTQSTGTVKIAGADTNQLHGKHVLLCEDIIDSGLTMSKLVPHLEQCGPASVRVASLLEKRTSRSCGYQADYVGFRIPDEFVVGYCLDYNEVYRDLNHICVINEAGIQKYRV